MNEKRTPSFKYALFSLSVVVLSISLGLIFFDIDFKVLIFFNWFILYFLVKPLGFSFEDIEGSAYDTVRSSMQAILILFAIGGLTSAWIASGTVPSVVYLGLKIMNAKYFLASSLIICSLVSLATGTSWGTFGTMGIALVGIGNGLGVPVGMTVGAVISGAWFGDKMSPLSDTTNFSAAIVGANLMTHVRHMIYTTGPAYICSLGLYFWLGLKIDSGAPDYTMIDEITTGLTSNFNIGVAAVIPIVVIAIFFILKKPALYAISMGALAGILVAIFFQDGSVGEVFNIFLEGYNKTFDSPLLSKLLNRGGMVSMLNTVMILILTVGLGGMMKASKIVHVLVETISKKIKSVLGVVFSAMMVNYLSQIFTGSNYFSAVMTSSTMVDLFKSKKLKPENVSRIIEDCGTIGATLIPYSITTLFVVSTIGVPFSEWFPYQFLTFITPIFTLLTAATGIGMAFYSDEEFKGVQKELEIDT